VAATLLIGQPPVEAPTKVRVADGYAANAHAAVP